MTIALHTDSVPTLQRRRPTPGECVELVLARAAESRMRAQLTEVQDERSTLGRLALQRADELDELREIRDELRDELERVRADLDATRTDRDVAVMTSKRHARELVETAEALAKARGQARPIKTLCGALLHRYQPRTGRDEQLRVAVASASQVGYWREQLDELVVPEVTADAG